LDVLSPPSLPPSLPPSPSALTRLEDKQRATTDEIVLLRDELAGAEEAVEGLMEELLLERKKNEALR
jgi:hypothetical protein